MNREARRLLEKRLAREKKRDGLSEAERIAIGKAAKEVEQKFRRRDEEYIEDENRRTMMMYACGVLALRNVFGFGQDRCARYMAEIDRLMGELIDGSRTYESTQKELEDRLNIVVEI